MNSRTWLAAAMGLAAGLAVEAAGQAFMRPVPIFWPDGRAQYPFHVLASGVWATPTRGVLTMGGGVYHEPTTLSKPMKITAQNGSAVIGPAVQQRVSLKVASYNTHLFGLDMIPLLPRWMDSTRAHYVDDNVLIENADVMMLQEVWDPYLAQIIATGVSDTYVGRYYGGSVQGSSVLNSGLYTLSKYLLSDAYQGFYSQEHGVIESMASKGFIRATFFKGGIPITVFNTHTQSGDSQDEIDTRLTQLQELAIAVQIWRAVHQDHVVIVAGDFNVIGLSNEYIFNMQSQMGTVAGLAEGAKNIPILGNSDNCTSCMENELNFYFNPESSDTRLDYILYAGSLDGSVVVVPKSYMRRDYEVPQPHPTICHDNLCTRNLSDHYGVVMEFELVRP